MAALPCSWPRHVALVATVCEPENDAGRVCALIHLCGIVAIWICFTKHACCASLAISEIQVVLHRQRRPARKSNYRRRLRTQCIVRDCEPVADSAGVVSDQSQHATHRGTFYSWAAMRLRATRLIAGGLTRSVGDGAQQGPKQAPQSGRFSAPVASPILFSARRRVLRRARSRRTQGPRADRHAPR